MNNPIGKLLWSRAIRTYSTANANGEYVIHIDVPVRFHDPQITDKVRMSNRINYTMPEWMRRICYQIDDAIRAHLIKSYSGYFMPTDIYNCSWGRHGITTLRNVSAGKKDEIYALWKLTTDNRELYGWIHYHHDWKTNYH